MYRTILVPIAFDDGADDKVGGALDVARRLAAPDPRVVLLHVMEEAPAYAIHYLPQDYVDAARAAVEAELARLVESVPGGEAEVVPGHAARTILLHAEANRADLIVIASHRPGMQDLLLGSTASHVVRQAPCAVHVTR